MALHHFIILCSFISLSREYIPKYLHDDFLSLVKHFNLKNISVIHGDTLTNLVSLRGSTTKELYLSLEMRFSVVKCGDLSVDTFPEGAFFYPLTRDAQPCTTKVTDKLLRSSQTQRPLFLYALHESKLPSWIFNMYIPFDSSVFVIMWNALNERWLTLQEIFHLSNGSDLVQNALGSRKIKGCCLSKWLFDGLEFDQRKRFDLRGSKIKTLYPGVIFEVPDSILTKGYRELEGTFQTVCDSLNASIEQIVIHDMSILNKLLSTVADVALQPLSSHSDNDSDVISFTVPYSFVRTRIFIRRPEFSYSLASVLGSFTPSGWLAIASILLALSLAMKTISLCTRHVVNGDDPQLSLSKCLLISLGIFCAQGWERLPHSPAGRVVVASSLFVGLFLNSLFVLQLQASLASKQSPLPFSGLNQLAESDYAVYAAPLGLPHADISKGETDVKRKLKSMLRYYDDEIGGYPPVNATCFEKLALLVPTLYIDLFVDRFACPIVDTKVDLYYQWACLPMSRNYRFKKVIDLRFRHIVEAGIVQRSESNSVLLKHVPVEGYAFEVVELSMVIECFILYAFALATAFFIFLLELVSAKVRNFQMDGHEFEYYE